MYNGIWCVLGIENISNMMSRHVFLLLFLWRLNIFDTFYRSISKCSSPKTTKNNFLSFNFELFLYVVDINPRVDINHNKQQVNYEWINLVQHFFLTKMKIILWTIFFLSDFSWMFSNYFVMMVIIHIEITNFIWKKILSFVRHIWALLSHCLIILWISNNSNDMRFKILFAHVCYYRNYVVIIRFEVIMYCLREFNHHKCEILPSGQNDVGLLNFSSFFLKENMLQ